MADKTEKRIYLVRHGFSEHNVGKMSHLRDPNLTALGEAQARQLHAITKDTLQQTAGLLVTSPLRRAMSTAILGFPALRDRLSKDVPGGIVALDLLQEVERKNCNCALYPFSELASSNDGMYAQLDFSALSSNYADKSGIFDPDNAAERARQARLWLRNREESEIVDCILKTSHGEFLRFLVYGYNDFKTHTWDNLEVKVCVFKPSDAGDHEAWLEVVESIRLPSSTDAPTSSGM